MHHLTRSLACAGSGLAEDCLAAAILPVTLDTPMNRKWMAKADQSAWTPLGLPSHFSSQCVSCHEIMLQTSCRG